MRGDVWCLGLLHPYDSASATGDEVITDGDGPEIVKGGEFTPVQVAGPNVDVRQLGRKQYRVSKHAGARRQRAKGKKRR